MLSTELWLSFGSLIRAYAAVSPSDAGHAPQVATTEETIIIAAGSARLDLAFDAASGAGNWTLSSSEAITAEGLLHLLPEGRIAIDGKPVELDHAAIDLVALLVSAAASSARNER